MLPWRASASLAFQRPSSRCLFKFSWLMDVWLHQAFSVMAHVRSARHRRFQPFSKAIRITKPYCREVFCSFAWCRIIIYFGLNAVKFDPFFFGSARIFPFACINQLCIRERTSGEIVGFFSSAQMSLLSAIKFTSEAVLKMCDYFFFSPFRPTGKKSARTIFFLLPNRYLNRLTTTFQCEIITIIK